MTAPTRYAKSGDVYIAYKTFGEGEEDVLITLAATLTMDFMQSSSIIPQVAAHARVTIFDKRGTGESDRVASLTFEERIDDLRAVMDALHIDSAHLFGSSEGGPMSIFFAATYPERVRSLTLFGTYPAFMRKADYPFGFDMTLREYSRWVDRVERAYAGDEADLRWFLELWTPSMAANPDFIASMSRIMRGASPTSARLIWDSMYEVDVRHVLPSVAVPTTIVHFTGDQVCPIEGGRYLAAHIPGARLVEVAGTDHLSAVPVPEVPAAILDNIERAKTRHVRDSRRLATVLFTDIVNSTPAATLAGDRAWTEVLDRHDRVSARVIADHDGRLVKSTGDGLLATFDGPSRAVRCAAALHIALAEVDIPIRAGLHTGEIELRGDDIAGIAVHIASRVSGLARDGETLVSSTVRDLVVGSGFTFVDRGDQDLKGVERPWRCYLLEAV